MISFTGRDFLSRQETRDKCVMCLLIMLELQENSGSAALYTGMHDSRGRNENKQDLEY
jgi:hypothetical protein